MLGTLSGAQHAKLVAIGIGHHHPVDVALADVDSSRPKGDQTVDLGSPIDVLVRRDVEMQAVLPGLRGQVGDRPR